MHGYTPAHTREIKTRDRARDRDRGKRQRHRQEMRDRGRGRGRDRDKRQEIETEARESEMQLASPGRLGSIYCSLLGSNVVHGAMTGLSGFSCGQASRTHARTRLAGRPAETEGQAEIE